MMDDLVTVACSDECEPRRRFPPVNVVASVTSVVVCVRVCEDTRVHYAVITESPQRAVDAAPSHNRSVVHTLPWPGVACLRPLPD